MHTDAPACDTLANLAAYAGKAELVEGEIVAMPPIGDTPGVAGDEIYFSLRKHVERERATPSVTTRRSGSTCRTARRSAPTRPTTRDRGRG